MKLLVGVTGATGSVYTIYFLNYIVKNCPEFELSIIYTNYGRQVCKYETGADLLEWANNNNVIVYKNDNMFADPASGTNRIDHIVILPCSMSTISSITYGSSNTLLERVCDVGIKEKSNIILATRESPFSSLHLKNMLACSQYGITIFPLTIAMYLKPKSLDDAIVGQVYRILSMIGVKNINTSFKWKA